LAQGDTRALRPWDRPHHDEEVAVGRNAQSALSGMTPL
jgi:hypothetical protein